MKTNTFQKILVIDDETSVSRFLRHSLESNGFQVVEAHDGKTGLQKATEHRPDLIVLDFGLPDLTGIEVLKNLREWTKVPVIFLTVRDGEADKVAALDSGADDYLTKPFGVPELMARIRVALRRAAPQKEAPVFVNGVLSVDRSGHVAQINGRDLKLTATEYALLNVLIQHAGKVVPHRTILNEVWGPNSVEHNHYLRVYFGQIRKKMEQLSPASGEMIENESGIGYRMVLLNT